jgi:transcriptional regulator with XRE-family HTH domain
MSIFSKRLKEARQNVGLSQERLGVLAGIDELSSSARMNQYERGKHEPYFTMVTRIAHVLNVPESYFYSTNDELAWLIVAFHRTPAETQQKIIQYVREQIT